uniref:Venom dipeptidyl peptidase 4 n=1 Tax=Strigamia maritima TaxID=126957 RepID=T1JEK3_STRMM
MVYGNDIYYKSSIHADLSKRITNSGVPGVVWNGVPDWLYEEEILQSNYALWFSDDGTMLCYATFNDSKVDAVRFPVYGEPSQVYPKMENIHYPKPGYTNPDVQLRILNLNEPDSEHFLQPPTSLQNQLAGLTNPTVVLWVVNMTERRTMSRDLKPPLGVKDQLVAVWDHYFSTVRWIDNKTVSVVWLNRPQNISIITICTAPLWYCNESHQVNTGGQGWVDITPPPLFSKAGNKYFAIIPALHGNSGFYKQLAAKTIPDNRLDFLTNGKLEVTDIKYYDEVDKAVYYIAAPEGKPGQRHLHRVFESIKGGDCLTCHLGPDCLYVDAIFSRQGKYFVLECLGPAPPTIYLYLTKNNNKSVAVLNSNSRLQEFVAGKAMPQIRTFRVTLERNFEAQVRLYLPPGLRDGEITKYPLIVNVYAGPGSQLVSERFQSGWGLYLSSQRDMIYAVIDGRGSGFQGTRVLFELYRKLGTVEVQDQITVTDFLKTHLHFVDPDRTAIWGASYGGYVTALVMANDKQVFNCGISVAPVTSWEYYDTAYTERYMGLPTIRDNKEGYEKASVLNKAAHFKTKKFLLIHGTRDDNVHFQNSMMLTKALVNEGVMFRTQVYPDENHGLWSVKKHQLEVMEEFLKDCFKVEAQTEEIGLQSKKH